MIRKIHIGIVIWMIITALVFIFASCSAYAWTPGEKWDKYDTAILTASSLAIIADWGTTLDIARQPKKYYEKNHFLSQHPSVGKVNTHFMGALAINAGIMYFLPNPYRKIYGAIIFASESYIVGQNLNIGLKVKF